MKKIIIKDEEFFYDIEHGATFFYKERKVKSFWSGIKSEYIDAFWIVWDIESTNCSKEEMRALVEKAYNGYVKRKSRQSEIDKGEII